MTERIRLFDQDSKGTQMGAEMTLIKADPVVEYLHLDSRKKPVCGSTVKKPKLTESSGKVTCPDCAEMIREGWNTMYAKIKARDQELADISAGALKLDRELCEELVHADGLAEAIDMVLKIRPFALNQIIVNDTQISVGDVLRGAKARHDLRRILHDQR